MNKLRVAVLMGGQSSEREVSLVSGKEVTNHLDREKYEVLAIDVPGELDKLDSFQPDVVFIALHGKGGEDGQIQGYLETKGWKYTGCGVLASALGMDKRMFRVIMERFKLPMPKLTATVPCVVKPANGGSSVGVSIVKKQSELLQAIEEAKKYSDEVIVEEYIEGKEFTCGVLGDQVLPVVEIKPKKEFFDYEAKYKDGMSEEICPAQISVSLTKRIQKLTWQVFEAVKGKGYARVDFRVRGSEVYILEINTLPGMTPNSLLPKEAKAIGLSYSELLDKMIELIL